MTSEVMHEKDIFGHGEVLVEHFEKKFIKQKNRKVEMETEFLCQQCGTNLERRIIGTVRVQPCGHSFCNFCWEGRKEKDYC